MVVREDPKALGLARSVAGMWWQPVAGEALSGAEPLLRGAASTDAEAVAGGGGSGASGPGEAGGASTVARLLALAAAQRMNTDTRRAVFVAIMGSEVSEKAAGIGLG